MTLYEANTIFLNDIYDKSGSKSNNFIIKLKTGSYTNKDIFKFIVANKYVKLLQEFKGEYNDLYNERTLYNVYKFLEEYYGVKLQYGWEYITAKINDWILQYGTWDDQLFWVDSEFWND